MRSADRTLSRTLAVQMSVVALGVSLALIVFFGVRYMLDTEELHRLTLEAQVHDVMSAFRQGKNPTDWALYKDYPKSYGFRVYDHRQAWQRKVIAEANADLLPAPAATSAGPNPEPTQDFIAGFAAIPSADGGHEGNRWLLTGRDTVGDHVYWIQAVMVDDPAWRWVGVMESELLDHVVLPVLFIVPALTLAAYLTARRALRPLTKVARQAAELGTAVMSGRPFAPLPDERLPLEFRSVVTAINAMLGKLDRSLTLQKQFTSDAAHELRTPLAVLLLELSRFPPGPEVERLKREVSDLGDLVNQLLRFAQAEDAMARERRPVDVAGAARKVCEDLAEVAFERQKSIEFDAPEGDVLVSGHPALIDAAIRNIVDNAVKHSPPRSVISVKVDNERNVIVDDLGPGVPEPQKKLIFERFWRGDRRREGMGIGLALVRRVALLHGGDVHVENRPGGGARFVLALGPAAAA
ncbi:MAG TPA: HAMP domain-containing sensor histidine kinase [Stellaceae bacterium]|nr:HAMP domain-containing sensor histidine kinase [Stellaceae bacterium]